MKILEDDEVMSELSKIDMDQIETHINICTVINYLNSILQIETNSQKHDLAVNNQIRGNIFEFTGLEVQEESLDRSNIEEISDILQLSLAAIDIEKILLKRLLAVLDISAIEVSEEDSLLEAYENALSVCQFGYKIVHKRDINEIYVNNYNKEWIINWNANTDLQLCLDYYGLITYISDYFCKDDSV